MQSSSTSGYCSHPYAINEATRADFSKPSFQNFEYHYSNFGRGNVQNILAAPVISNQFKSSLKKVTPSMVNIRKELREILSSMNSLKHVYNELMNATSTADEWMANAKMALEIKVKLQECQTRFFTDSNVNAVLRKLKLIANRRLRSAVKRSRRKSTELETLSRERDKKHEKIDGWRESILQKNKQLQREREMKKEADSILAEVRRKKLENGRNVEIIAALERLRESRKRGGVVVRSTEDEHFEKTTSKLKEMLDARARDYNAEERALQVILESEQQKTEDERLEKRKGCAEKQMQTITTNYCASLFGNYDKYSRYPYVQNQRPSTDSLDSFLVIRHEWDIWASSADQQDGGGSSVPTGWVQPVAPSSDAWKSALQ